VGDDGIYKQPIMMRLQQHSLRIAGHNIITKLFSLFFHQEMGVESYDPLDLGVKIPIHVIPWKIPVG
jgi:hypothetical protein